jgi:phthiocerol/phenolphthiocerol synthesis type-I polyketide synthase A
VGELERLGSPPLEPGEAFEAWEHVAAYDVAQAVVIPVPDGGHSDDADDQPASAPLRDWSQLSAAEVYRELYDALRAIVARELRLGEHELQIELPFADLGLNSLTTMSIRREAEILVGFELPTTMLWNHPTVGALAAYLTDKVAPQDDSADCAEQPPDADNDIGVMDDLYNSVEAGAMSGKDNRP